MICSIFSVSLSYMIVMYVLLLRKLTAFQSFSFVICIYRHMHKENGKLASHSFTARYEFQPEDIFQCLWSRVGVIS